MKILAIDPGSQYSGFVVVEVKEEISILVSETDVPNYDLRRDLWDNKSRVDVCVIEDIEGMGLRVGKDTFDTCKWIGRFCEAWGDKGRRVACLVSRGDEKIVLCGKKTYKNPKTGKQKAISDSELRAAIMDRFPGTGGGRNPVIGISKKPGPLFRVKGHAWSALGVAITWIEMNVQEKALQG